ncbi:MAG: ABC transporter ATP-binding protein [Bdellovibrionales bacterium]|nr:ABC transporter ATP-binding protein [Bdellovibrionales bacterium]
MSVIFSVKDLQKIYGEDQPSQVYALDGVTLEINKGEFTSIVGPSGSGKSTLLNIFSGLDRPTHGEVFLKGQNLTTLSDSEMSDFRRDHIGFIFQSYNLIPVLTVLENIEYIMLLQGKTEKERRLRVEEVLAEVRLEGMENRFPNQLSGGQQQRVAVARAMASKPDIILADEPTANLDSTTGTELVEMMKRLNKMYETTFVFSTHDPIIMERAKRLVVLKDGKVADEIWQTG